MSMADLALGLAVGAGIAAISTAFALDKLAKRVTYTERCVQALFEYAKEIDPRHDEERAILRDLDEGGLMAGINHLDYTRSKNARGERTLFDPLIPFEDR